MKLDFESNISTFVPGASDVVAESVEPNNSAEVSLMLREGIAAAQSGKSAEARSLLLRVTEIDAENEKAWLWLASISEYPEELLVFLNNVLRINPENQRAIEWAKATKSLLSKTFVQRGIDAANEPGDFSKQCFLQATIHDSENEMAWLWLASISDSDDEKASYLQRVLAINAENETAKDLIESMTRKKCESIFAQAEMFASQGENEQSLYALEEYLRQSPEAENAWVLKSFLVASLAQKLECFERVLEANPENEMAKLNADYLRPMMEKSSPEEAKLSEPEEAAMEEAEMSAPQNFAEEAAEEEISAQIESEAEMQSEAETEAEFSEESHAEPQHFSMMEEEVLVSDEMDEEAFEPQAEFESPEARSEESRAMETEEPQAEREESAPLEAENFDDSQAEEMEFAEEMEAAEENFEAGAESADESGQENSYAFYQPEEKPEYYNEPENFFSAETQTFNSEEINMLQAETESHADAQELPQVYAFGQVSPEVSAESEEVPEAETSMENYLQSAEATSEVYEIEQSETAMAENNYSHIFEAAHPESEIQKAESDAPNYFDEENAFAPKAEMVSCLFCDALNEQQSIVCHSCRAVLTFADLEMVLANYEADKEMIGNAVCRMETVKEENGFGADETKLLALGYLNLGNLPKGLNFLMEAAKMNPDDIVLSSQINALKIRAAEIEKQNEIHESMPKNLTILVVDDSATVRKLISGKLEKSGHEVICAIDGIEALEKIRDLVPDLVLLDINMPRMDGYQVCKMIRANEATKDVPVVMISGKDGFFDKVRGRMAGTTGYITKPFGPETLMKTVETYIV